MIPLVLPFAIAILVFFVLAVTSYVVFAGIDGLIMVARKKNLPGASHAAARAENIGAAVAAPPLMGRAPARVEGYALPESLYYHQGHSWVAPQEEGTVVVGIDDFAGKLIGRLSAIVLPRVGERRRQGEKGWTLRGSGKSIDMLFPVDGEVVAINEKALENPSAVSEEPYGAGWLMMIKPRDLKRNLRNLLRGSAARSWTENSAAELRSVFSGNLGMVFQDGGLPEEGLAEHFATKDWTELTGRIFMIEPGDSGR